MRRVVAASKLMIPSSRRSLVPRPDLAARLDGDYRVGLVSAPAGYGKTATLAAWAASVEEPLAWLSCDATDVEPTRFMTCLLSALEHTWPGVADDAFVLLDRDGSAVDDAAVAVGNELGAVGARGAVVVDDLHMAAPQRTVLTAFLGALPAGVRFVAGTRSDPPLSLTRWRLRGDLVELRRDDLRFGPAEVAEFLRLRDVSLATADRAHLYELTEGWPAGVQLATIALQTGAERDDFLTAFTRTDRSVSDFLMTEVLTNLSPEIVEFLLATSVFETFDAELGAAVTGAEDAALMLERLEADNLFLVPVAPHSRWYRYHRLFSAFLQARLASLGHARLVAAHDRAGRALEARGDIAGALHHAVALSDAERAGEILLDAADRSMSLSGAADIAVQAIRMWLHHFGAELAETEPMKVLDLLVGLITLNAPDDVPMWLDRVRRAHPDPDGPVHALIEGAWGEYRQHRGEPLAAIRHEQAAMDAVHGRPPAEGLLALLPTVMARAHIEAGDLASATLVIEHALTNPVGSRIPDDVRHPALAAFLAARAGELSRVEGLTTRAVRAADALTLGPYEPGRIFAALARAALLVERVEDESAARLLEGAKAMGEESHRVVLQAMIALEQARAARAFGDEAGAAALLEHARMLYRAPDAAVLHVLGEEAARQALRFDPGRTRSMLESLDQDRPATLVLRAQLALLERDDRAAADMLARLPPPTTRRDRVERAVLSALSLLERDVEAANDRVRDALAAAQPEGLLRAIVDLAPDVHRVLKAYAPDPGQEQYLEELLTVAGRAVAPMRIRPATTTLVEPLSEREVTVLRYLSSRLTYQEVAAALYVSLNTLKSHVRSVYRKLGVASRADAVVAGRQHGLI
jgi:LuxR family maltose regulon positive regulatory protein